MREMLEHDGYEVIEACDGAEGLDRLLADRPPIVASDLSMPNLNGIEFVTTVRATDLDWYPYIIVLTGCGEPNVALDAGADDFIAKPISKDDLLPRIRAGERIVSLHEELRRKNGDLKAVNQQLEKLATKDPLTNLLNRREFVRQIETEWRRAQRYDLPLSCLVLDIDYFKRVNDTYGHPAGDAVIRTIGLTLSQRLRETDIVCRFGGEEFCALLTNTPLQQAAEVADDLRAGINELAIPQLPGDARVAVSVGAASRSLETLTSDALLDRADQALLIAKRTGRNRVVRHDELEHSLSLMGENADPDAEKDRTRVDSAALIPYHIVNTLLTALKYRDPSTVSHSQRVARMCRQFGQQLGLPPAERLTLEFAALLHDAGKLATPDELLSKTGKLTEEEFAEVQKHRNVTVDLMSSCFSNPSLVEIVELSDRWYDGSHGKPHGENIPQGARILAIISLYDDMTHGRAWWAQQSTQDALDKIENLTGSQFDPDLTIKFAAMVRTSEEPAEICV